jgi:hypothetical protein
MSNDKKTQPPVKVDEKWLITWVPNSEYIAQEGRHKLPAGHSETILHDGTAESWVKANPQKSVIFCFRLK